MHLMATSSGFTAVCPFKMTAGEDLNETLHKGGIYNKVKKCCKLMDVAKVNYNTNKKGFLAIPKDKGGKSFFFPR